MKTNAILKWNYWVQLSLMLVFSGFSLIILFIIGYDEALNVYGILGMVQLFSWPIYLFFKPFRNRRMLVYSSFLGTAILSLPIGYFLTDILHLELEEINFFFPAIFCVWISPLLAILFVGIHYKAYKRYSNRIKNSQS